MSRWRPLVFACATVLLCARAAEARPGELLDEVWQRVRRDHVDARDLVPARLLDAALMHASEAYPALIVSGAAAGNAAEPSGPWRLEVNDAVLVIGEREAAGASSLAGALGRVLSFLAHALPEAAPAEVEATLIAGMLRAVDPHTEFFTPRAYREFIGSTTGDIAGIGLVVSERGGIHVEEVLPGAPGARAGIRAGDAIVEVGSHFAGALTMDEAVALLRGEVGQPVEVGVLSPGARVPRRVRMVREAIHFPAAEGELLVYPEGAYGYIRLRAFQSGSAGAVSRLAEPWTRPHARAPAAPLGLILDLRGNPGGGLSEAIDVADLFLREGVIVKTVQPNRGGQSARASDSRDDLELPLVVLIDQRSASASEIVAAALKNHLRAVVIGERSVGKGTVQSVFPLSAGHALKLTIAKYLTPGDLSIQGVGVTPHVLLRPVEAGPGRYRLRPEADPREHAEGTALSAPPGPRPGAPLAIVPVLAAPQLEPEGASARGPEAGHADAALDLAREILAAHGGKAAAGIVDTALRAARQRIAAHDDEVVRRLAAQGIDWRASPQLGASQGAPSTSAPVLRIERVHAEVSSDGEHWRAAAEGALPGERLRLALRVRNTGGAPAVRVLALLRPLSGADSGAELPLGWIAPGTIAEREVEWALPGTILPPAEPIEVLLVSQAVPGAEPLLRERLFLPVREAGPMFYSARIALAEEGDGDGRWERGETLVWSLRLLNGGAAPLPGGRLLAQWPRPGIAAVIQDLPLDPPNLAPGEAWEAQARMRRVSDEPIAPATVAIRARVQAPSAPPLEWRVTLAPELPRQPLDFVPPEIVWRNLPLRAAGSLVLTGEARDDHMARNVTLHVNRRKTHHIANPALRPVLPVHAELILDPGWNRIQVAARDDDNLVTHRAFGVWNGNETGLTLGAIAR